MRHEQRPASPRAAASAVAHGLHDLRDRGQLDNAGTTTYRLCKQSLLLSRSQRNGQLAQEHKRTCGAWPAAGSCLAGLPPARAFPSESSSTPSEPIFASLLRGSAKELADGRSRFGWPSGSDPAAENASTAAPSGRGGLVLASPGFAVAFCSSAARRAFCRPSPAASSTAVVAAGGAVAADAKALRPHVLAAAVARVPPHNPACRWVGMQVQRRLCCNSMTASKALQCPLTLLLATGRVAACAADCCAGCGAGAFAGAGAQN